MSNSQPMRAHQTPACAKCAVYKCRSPDSDSSYPRNCPHESYAETRERTIGDWAWPATKAVLEAGDQVLKEGYGKWSRVNEVIEYSRMMGYKRLGIAFCVGLRNEAKVLHNALEASGFEVVSVCCMAGGPLRAQVGFDSPIGLPKTLCNPLMQAEVLSQNETELNIMLGLCVGHDILFIKHSRAPVTPLVVKDRVFQHNPIAALSSQQSQAPRKPPPYLRSVIRFLRRLHTAMGIY